MWATLSTAKTSPMFEINLTPLFFALITQLDPTRPARSFLVIPSRRQLFGSICADAASHSPLSLSFAICASAVLSFPAISLFGVTPLCELLK